LLIFLADYSVLAIPLLMSPIVVFLRDVWIRTQKAAIASKQAPCSPIAHLFFFFFVHFWRG
jgi:hypothetical protein